MLRTATCALIASAAVGVAMSAHAQEDYSRLGCYLGLAGTVAFANSAEDFLEKQTGGRADVDESLGLQARAGCRGAWIGGELHFEWLEGFDTKVVGEDFRIDSTIDGWILSLDGKLFPLAGIESRLPPWAKRLQPFATIGMGYLTLDGPAGIDDWDFAARFGGGLDVYVTRNIAVSIDTTYVLPVSDQLDDLDYVSVGWGLLYRF